ncbi:hypothetical protein RHODO2019_02485 [Rhodococcus antarcticus]|uniref:Excreted virulence factor EspC (Type VII ESX diderm) n=1 Tax=Rhodococcus antarcticus TaxID=2987751 RepID=A0ABY6P166_9NOCA|nr:hypothetical protein [Rhodococcus antarcticus]UZJ25366.1 hypothetical protein RHODO2019_02485 [Rhodococcus antarcticus]
MSDHVDVLRDEVSASANRFRAVGDTVQDAVGKAGACSFGSGTAGREYSAQGSAVQAATSTVVQVVMAWQSTTGDVADSVIGAVDAYTAQEASTTSAVTAIVA